MENYAIEILTETKDELQSTIRFVEDPTSVRYYKDDDEEDLKRWKKQIKDIEDALEILKRL